MINIFNIYPVDPEAHPEDYMAGLLRSILMRSNFAVHQRNVLGWRGLRPICKGGDGWTCRIEGKEGIYGIFFKREEREGENIRGIFSLYYFPEAKEEIIDTFPIQASIFKQHPQYAEMARDFLIYPDFYPCFEIGEVSISLTQDRKALWIDLAGLKQMKDHSEQDLLASNQAYAFFEVFVSTLVVTLENPVESLFHRETADKILLAIGFGQGDFDACRFKEQSMQSGEVLGYWNAESEEIPPFPGARWWSIGDDSALAQASDTEDNSQNRPALIVLSGFLGSGKTSFLKQFIEYHVGFNRFVAVIQNEIGEQGLDGNLLEDDYAVLEMDEGCVCCSLVSQLKKGIKKILNDHRPEVIILETTGLANPYNLLDELYDIKDLVQFKAVCTVVDAKNFSHSASFSGIVSDQLRAANKVLLNKTDLITEGEQVEILDKIYSLNPEATVFPCTYGKVNPSSLFGEESDYWESCSLKQKAAEDQEAVTHHDHSDDGISSRKFKLKHRLEKTLLLSIMESLPESIFRAKGVVDIEGEVEPCILQYVHGNCSLEGMNRNIPEERFLVFIGKSKVVNQLSIFFN